MIGRVGGWLRITGIPYSLMGRDSLLTSTTGLNTRLDFGEERDKDGRKLFLRVRGVQASCGPGFRSFTLTHRPLLFVR